MLLQKKGKKMDYGICGIKMTLNIWREIIKMVIFMENIIIGNSIYTTSGNGGHAF